jgi:hypothetical protein
MSKTGLKRTEVKSIILSFLKEEKMYNATLDQISFYKLFALYPDKEFWLKYSLPFKLNGFVWLTSEDGLNRIKQDYSVYLLKIVPQFDKIVLSETKFGEDMKFKKKIRTIADLFKK